MNLPFGGFEIMSELDRGSSETYMALQESSGRSAILKITRNRRKAASQEALYGLLSLRQIKGIQPVISTAREGSCFYAVSEYIGGRSADNLVLNNAKPSTADIIKWYHQLACALRELHALDICHRDIKPANIVISDCGDAFLIDFDSATILGLSGTATRSIGYSPPEQEQYYDFCIKGANLANDKIALKLYRDSVPGYIKNIDWKLADIYSLGATMHHIATGSIISGGLLKIPAVGGIIKKSTEAIPSERYQSANDLCLELEEWR